VAQGEDPEFKPQYHKKKKKEKKKLKILNKLENKFWRWMVVMVAQQCPCMRYH
jgi:hypothetical protein